jgi:hypothetical protein
MPAHDLSTKPPSPRYISAAASSKYTSTAHAAVRAPSVPVPPCRALLSNQRLERFRRHAPALACDTPNA